MKPNQDKIYNTREGVKGCTAKWYKFVFGINNDVLCCPLSRSSS